VSGVTIEFPRHGGGSTVRTVNTTSIDVLAEQVAANSPTGGIWAAGRWQSWATAVDYSKLLARAFAQGGVGAGDVFAVQYPNGFELVALHIAVGRAGGVVFPVHQAYGPREIVPMLERAGVTALVAHERHRGQSRAAYLQTVLAQSPSVGAAWIGRRDRSLDAVPLSERPGAVRPATRDAAPAVLLASSGTTSLEPKICVHSAAGVFGNVAALVAEAAYGPGDTFLATGPMSHSFGLSSLHLALVSGGSLATVDGADPAQLLATIREADVSVLMAVPAVLRDLVNHLRQSGATPPVCVREVRTGGAHVPPSLVAEVSEVLGARVVVQWGMSEIGIGCYTRGTGGSLRGGVGHPIAGAQVRIRRTDGVLAADGYGEIGELEIQTPFAFDGYVGAPEATAAALDSDGWLRTGDLATLDVDGSVRLHGRTDERINRGGMKYSVTEVEALLSDMARLHRYAIVPRPDERLGERAVLVASVRDGATVSLDDVVAHLRGKAIAAYKLPEALLVVDAVPTNAVGKILRARVRALVTASMATAAAPS
jgi:cyclohexanecarboxylate-CoA ligase